MSAAVATAVVVDDDADVRHMLVQVFEAAGFSTIAVGTGSEGVQAVLSMRPLIVSLDVTMPGVDGIEAARLIRAAGADTHIIMITASRDETDVVLGLSAGADEYVYKPLRVRELRARIDAVLRRALEAGAAPAPPAPAPSPRTTHIDWTTAPPPAAPVYTPAPEPVYAPAPAAVYAPTPAPVYAPAAVPAPAYASMAESPAPYAHADALMNQQVGTPIAAASDLPVFLVHADLIVDPARRIVQLAGRTIALDGVELMLLVTLMQSKRLTRSKADLAVLLRGGPSTPKPHVPPHEKSVIDNHVASLRRKLGDDGAKARYIEPVEPIGYRMVAEG